MGRKNASDRRERRQARKEKEARKQRKAEAKSKRKAKNAKEEDLDALIAQFMDMDKGVEKVTELPRKSVSARAYASLVLSPTNDELILFGGEFTNGIKTFVYGELLFYNIKKDDWRNVQIPKGPPPRSGHQAVSVSRLGGQMWVFGGEYSSPTGSTFKHFNDLWCLNIKDKKWMKVTRSGAPSSRSGHRMVLFNKCLVVFGGFHDDAKHAPKYFNDVHLFDLENYRWDKLVFPQVKPAPDARSACQMVATKDGVYVYGGYSKSRVRGEVYKGVTHTDMWRLEASEDAAAAELYAQQLENKDLKKTAAQGAFGVGLKWEWTRVRPSGAAPSQRSGAAAAVRANGSMVSFGGVCDEETDDALKGQFFDDLYQLNTNTLSWSQLRVKRTEGSPCARMSANICCKGNTLFMFGGILEVGDKQITLNDLNSLDLNKLNEWKVLRGVDKRAQQWLEESSSEEEDDDDDDDA
ncbi:hypothetical protein PTSG_12104 [Salpingoeca rosetta]|uniref:Kelch domain-containing protein 4 n=1 Tax=Salpingoeca rosetta (strain ATCC 50818 / BSB-021) TaxID=946362 RepID=F2U7D0_SALR5|nr:uncharacterized protein PTSG_12104 [Salpingoeca rosetta]EGD83347.1 hypothetical protein PTSG_12104 [Salpingoeca rosetta]|eukprot:XP_004994851.1 hypothetical protein PTSG_12104 [Salpingoeca rosetta]